jgi:hypothetical protein
MAWRHDLAGTQHAVNTCGAAQNGEHDYKIINGGDAIDRGVDGERPPMKYHTGPIALFCSVCGDLLPINNA